MSRQKYDWNEIVQLYNDGCSCSEIAGIVGVPEVRYVYQVLKRCGIEATYHESTGIDVGKIKALRKAGWNISSIAWDCCLSTQVVREVLDVH